MTFLAHTIVLYPTPPQLCRESQAISVEDLYVNGILKNRHLSRAVSDTGLGECPGQLEYKAPLYDSPLNIIGQCEPSSTMCHRCKTVKNVLSLGERLFVCNAYGHIDNRDINTAENINQLGRVLPEVTSVKS